ncbi:MAG: polysaccharide deacetylase family protein [Candidatus Pacebacteria bacterium]|nr:polysaccharide deacetylase family protein [Candidatus Paceibacterota bacterium]
MPQICLYFQLHQPYRLQQYNVFDLGGSQSYFEAPINTQQATNKQIFQKVAAKSYTPMLGLLQKLLERHLDFNLALSCSGVFLEQAQHYSPQVINQLKQLADTGRVEFLAETYYHSLAFLYSSEEFKTQVNKHQQLIKHLFNQQPQVFRNTELIYSNYIGQFAAELGFIGSLTEAVDRYLDGREKTQVFASASSQPIPLLLKHALLSDDVAFRFSDRSWNWHPLQAEQYLDWIEVYPEEQFVNLFMDFETFGEHQWADTGIFQFFEKFVELFLIKEWNRFVQPTEVFSRYAYDQTVSKGQLASPNSSKTINSNQKVNQDNKLLISKLPVYDVPEYISWADLDRDLTAWNGNQLQRDALRALYQLQEPVLQSGDQKLIEDWRRLQTSDHFYYMCTKWSADGDVHAYFSPYDSPLEAYRRYSVVLADLRQRLI